MPHVPCPRMQEWEALPETEPNTNGQIKTADHLQVLLYESWVMFLFAVAVSGEGAHAAYMSASWVQQYVVVGAA